MPKSRQDSSQNSKLNEVKAGIKFKLFKIKLLYALH